MADERATPPPGERPGLLIEDGDLIKVNESWDVFVPPSNESPLKAKLRRWLAQPPPGVFAAPAVYKRVNK